MRILFKRRPQRAAESWPAESENLYGLWVTSPSEVSSRLPAHVTFTPPEVDTAALWSARQSSFGLRADVHENHCGQAALLEVFGPDDLVPHCIVYPTSTGIQADEFSGSSKVYPCLEAALHEIAPLY